MEPRTGNPVGKELHLRMDHMEEVRVVAHALSSDVRLRILAMIGATSMNVNEIARELGAPVSTTALNIQVLERAGLVSCEMQPGARGAMKMCVRGIDRVHISLSPTPRGERRVWECEMPVGCYALVGGVQPTCGMANRNCKMNADDDPRSFYRPTILRRIFCGCARALWNTIFRPRMCRSTGWIFWNCRLRPARKRWGTTIVGPAAFMWKSMGSAWACGIARAILAAGAASGIRPGGTRRARSLAN